MTTINVGDRVKLARSPLVGVVVELDADSAIVRPDGQHHVVRESVMDLEVVDPRVHPSYDEMVAALGEHVRTFSSRTDDLCTVAGAIDWLAETHRTNRWIAEHTVRLAIMRGLLDVEPTTATGAQLLRWRGE